MNEQHPLNTLAPANHNNQPPLTHLAPATLNVNEPNAVNIQAEAAINIKPLWLEFPTNHMKASLALLSVKELRQAASKSLSSHQVNGKCKEFQIDTILSHFHTLSMQYELLDNTHKSF
jgi:LAS superfamily LD-carboxypeptidase LdcB